MMFARKRGVPLSSVKEAMDYLPTGLCYFNRHGLLVFCNRTMYDLAYQLLQRDLQYSSELFEALEKNNETSSSEDGVFYIEIKKRVWKFAQYEILEIHDGPFIQVTATDISDLITTKRTYDARSKTLALMKEELHAVMASINDITKEEELLNMKMRVHDEVGRGILASRIALQNNTLLEKDIKMWEEALNLIVLGESSSSYEDSMADLVNALSGVGIQCEINGSVNLDDSRGILVQTCIKECSTNAIRHGQATCLYVNMYYKNDILHLEITNDGIPPKGPIKMGGGLSSLQEKITRAGGKLELSWSPQFKLLVILPPFSGTVLINKEASCTKY